MEGTRRRRTFSGDGVMRRGVGVTFGDAFSVDLESLLAASVLEVESLPWENLVDVR
jgi:hypothetical protein